MKRVLFAVAITIILTAAAAAGTKPRSGARITVPAEKASPVNLARFQKAPVIDGRLDDEVWKSATILRDFYQTDPGDNIAPSKPTEVLLGYDDKTLYIAFRATDEPGKVRANVAKRDNIFDDDYVGTYLDTFNDRRRCYALFFNPLGVQADGIMTEDRGEDYSIDIVMESKGEVTDKGYTVEVAIPFKSLHYEAGKGKLWNAHFFRRIKRLNNELDSWMPLSRDTSGMLTQAGHMTGIEGISTERTLEITPSLTLSETGRRVQTVPSSFLSNNPAATDPGRMVNSPLKFDPGLTIKMGLTPAITLDATVNPDFAQVEADQTVVTANQRFPIYFEEKRPFFFEGMDIFQTQMNVLHTRAIVDPDYAVKLSGRQGRNSFGLLMASDNAPGNYSEEERNDPEKKDDISRFLDKNAWIGVLRVKRDVGQEGNIGVMATSYSFIEDHNQLVSLDGRFRMGPKTFLAFQAVGTTSRRKFYDPDLDKDVYRTGNGLGYAYYLDMSGRHFGYTYSGSGRTLNYRADVGYTPRVNTNSQSLFLRYSSEPAPKAFLISWRAVDYVYTKFDWQGRSQNWGNESRLNLTMKHQTYITLGYDHGYERIFEEEFGARRTADHPGEFAGDDPERSTRKKDVVLWVDSNPSKKISTGIFVERMWGAMDYDYGAGPHFLRVSPAALIDQDGPRDPGRGNSFDTSFYFNYQPVASFKASLSYTKSRLTRYDTGRLAFDENIFSLRTTYQFSRFTFLRARVDYDTLDSRARSQFLFGWTPSPGTAFYAGYNEDTGINGFNPFTDRREPGFHRNGRTFFLKTSYLFRRSF